MDATIHSIELFKRIVAPRHTAFKTWIFDKFEIHQKKEKPKHKKNKRPSERWNDLEWLSVLNRNWQNGLVWYGFISGTKVFNYYLRCRAPP